MTIFENSCTTTPPPSKRPTSTAKRYKDSAPMTDVTKKLAELSTNLGHMQASINEIKNLQVDVVNMLRKLDRVDSRLDHLYSVVGEHEKDLEEINAERIGIKAKKEQTQWWLNNWRNLLYILASVLALSAITNPNLLAVIKGAL